jgi:hypothetical protein
MNFYTSFPVLVTIVASVLPVVAQVPQLLNYQGRVRVSNADFTGTGQFKFALVNAAGTTSYWSNDRTSTNASQPAAAVSLGVQGGLYQVSLGDATVPNMTALQPGVFQNSDVHLRVWFSDGVNAWQQLTPDQRIAAVGYALMADDVKNGAVSTDKLAAGAVTAAKIAPGAVTSAALAPNVVRDSLTASGQGTVPAGAALVSPTANAPALTAAGYVPAGSLSGSDSWSPIQGGTARDRAASVWTGTEMLIWGDGPEGWRYNPATNSWTAMSTTGQPANRESPRAVWSGTEMIVWGGRISTTYPNTGGRYNPTTNTWTALSLVNAPAGRNNATVIWTGSEMILFGGYNGTVVLGDTHRYNPGTGTGGTWTPVSAANPPAARHLHTAVWTGSEMIIFGGNNLTTSLADCAILNPVGAGSWTAGPAATLARQSHTAVWTGTKMLVWSGATFPQTTPVAAGAIYTRSSNTWTAMPSTAAPVARFQHAAVWTGQEMIVWGGTSSAGSTFTYEGSSGRFDPVNGAWAPMGVFGAPAGRELPNMEWTGSELILWGGSNGTPLNVGGRFRAGQTFYLFQKP